MINCCQCQGIEIEFNQKVADQELKQYRENGPAQTAGMLIDALKAERVEGMTLLDIGGGVGTIQHELLRAGVSRAINVEASTAYVKAAQEEVERHGHADRVSFYRGNFVELAPQIPATDIVTLDRVICCYHDMETLVGLSAARARKLYGLVYPRDTWWMKMALTLVNFFFWVRRNPFRTFVHPTNAVEAVVRGNGLKRRFHRQTLVWQVAVYAR